MVNFKWKIKVTYFAPFKNIKVSYGDIALFRLLKPDMWFVKIIWLMYIMTKLELISTEYYKTETKKAALANAYLKLPSATKSSCVLACKQDIDCRISAITSATCFLFKTEPETNDNGESLLLFKKGKIIIGRNIFHHRWIKRLISSGGGTTPTNCRKIREKTANSINMIFCKCYQNPL